MRRVINQKRLRTWEERTGVCCLLAGLLAPLLGGLLTVIEWIVGSAGHPWIHVTSTALFIVAIPLILFAGFCLDWAEQGQKKSAASTPRVTKTVIQPTLSPQDLSTSTNPTIPTSTNRTIQIGSG